MELGTTLVADVGNTRMKWGLFSASALHSTVSLPLDDPAIWEQSLASWVIVDPAHWTIAGTQPERLNELASWLRRKGHTVRILGDYRELPIKVNVQFPERIGIDRLLNAVAIRKRVQPGEAAIVIDAGSAVTVDLVDGDGVFQGGAIFPGIRLMGKALKDYTAQLPLVEEIPENPPLPGKNTVEAISAGIYYVLCGGIDRLVSRLRYQYPSASVFSAGGDASKLSDLDCRPNWVGSALTLEGIFIAASSGDREA